MTATNDAVYDYAVLRHVRFLCPRRFFNVSVAYFEHGTARICASSRGLQWACGSGAVLVERFSCTRQSETENIGAAGSKVATKVVAKAVVRHPRWRPWRMVCPSKCALYTVCRPRAGLSILQPLTRTLYEFGREPAAGQEAGLLARRRGAETAGPETAAQDPLRWRRWRRRRLRRQM